MGIQTIQFVFNGGLFFTLLQRCENSESHLLEGINRHLKTVLERESSYTVIEIQEVTVVGLTELLPLITLPKNPSDHISILLN